MWGGPPDFIWSVWNPAWLAPLNIPSPHPTFIRHLLFHQDTFPGVGVGPAFLEQMGRPPSGDSERPGGCADHTCPDGRLRGICSPSGRPAGAEGSVWTQRGGSGMCVRVHGQTRQDPSAHTVGCGDVLPSSRPTGMSVRCAEAWDVFCVYWGVCVPHVCVPVVHALGSVASSFGPVT